MTGTPADRLQSLDLVRGVAVMGILLLNIVSFGLPDGAYFNPRAYGGSDGADLATYLINFVFFDGRMRGLFSFLFGASMLLVIERAEAKGENPAQIHYRRMAWLLAFGLAHLWLVWDGDILAHYALVGMLAYLLRKLPVPRLLALGAVLVIFETFLLGGLPFGVYMLEHVPEGSARAAQAARQLAGFNHDFGIPGTAELAKDLQIHRGGYAGILAERLHANRLGPLNLLLVYGMETLAYMVFGMAALRSGLLRGEWSRADYRKWLVIGFGIGVPAYAALAAYMIGQDFSLFSVTLAVMALATPVRPLMILGWACLILLLARPGGALTGRIAAAGRMAFTNYLATSLICTTFFYGYGLGWYGHLSRSALYLVVLGVWGLMLLWSKPWLARYRYGPLEWLWRTLARGSLQPMRRAS
ncbi:MAG: DUF418 domain-containing protein [Pseudomonadota bacterium]